MVDRTYGLKYQGTGKHWLDNALFDSTMKTSDELASDAAQVLNSMIYDVSFNVHDHYSPESSNPLNTVAMHPREEYNKQSGLYRAIARFNEQEVHSRFGLSLEEYLSLPRDVIDMITEVVIEANKQMEQIESNEERNIQHGDHTRGPWRHFRK